MKKITKIMLSLGSFALILAGCHKPPVDATKFTITWKNDDGTVLEVDENVPKDTLPTYDGVTPIKASTAEFTYEFTGWNPEVTKVVSDMTYVAKYLAKAIIPETRYTVTAEEWSTLLGGSYSNATITTTQTMKNQLKATNYVSKEIEGVIYEYDDIKTKASEHAGREVSFSKEDYAAYCRKVEGTALTEEMWNEVINNPALGERSEENGVYTFKISQAGEVTYKERNDEFTVKNYKIKNDKYMMTINYEPVYNPRNDVVKEYFHSFAPYFDKAVFDENRKVYELNAQSLSEIMGEAIEGMSYLVYFENGAIHHTEAVAMMSDENFDQNLMLSFYLTKENETTVVVPETYDTCDHAGNMNDYYQHDEHCHYQPCTVCGGLVKWGAHEFDGDKCSVCGYIKVKRMHISVPGCDHDHIYYDLRESTGETEYVYFTGYQSNNYELTADGQKVTYNFVDCNFVATITDKTTLVAGETCKHEKMYTITFTRNGEKLREDAVIRGTYSYNHAFVFESESKDPLTCIKTTISRCSKCGEIQEIKIIDHQALTVTNHGVKNENGNYENASATCGDCHQTITGTLMMMYQNENDHALNMSFKVDGVMHYATIIEAHIFDEVNNCIICGYHKELPVSPKQEIFAHINHIFLNEHHHH